jgi:hypothetical protein
MEIYTESLVYSSVNYNFFQVPINNFQSVDRVTTERTVEIRIHFPFFNASQCEALMDPGISTRYFRKSSLESTGVVFLCWSQSCHGRWPSNTSRATNNLSLFSLYKLTIRYRNMMRWEVLNFWLILNQEGPARAQFCIVKSISCSSKRRLTLKHYTSGAEQ